MYFPGIYILNPYYNQVYVHLIANLHNIKWKVLSVSVRGLGHKSQISDSYPNASPKYVGHLYAPGFVQHFWENPFLNI